MNQTKNRTYKMDNKEERKKSCTYTCIDNVRLIYGCDDMLAIKRRKNMNLKKNRTYNMDNIKYP